MVCKLMVQSLGAFLADAAFSAARFSAAAFSLSAAASEGSEVPLIEQGSLIPYGSMYQWRPASPGK